METPSGRTLRRRQGSETTMAVAETSPPKKRTPQKSPSRSASRTRAAATPVKGRRIVFESSDSGDRTSESEEIEDGSYAPTHLPKEDARRSRGRLVMSEDDEEKEGDEEEDVEEGREKENDEEDRGTFDMGTFKSSVGELSAVDFYFLRGQEPSKNRSRKKRAKKDRTGQREERTADEEADSDEEGLGKSSAEDPRYAEIDLKALREHYVKSAPLIASTVKKMGSKHFSKWTVYLAAGYNVLVHGWGSHQALLHAYAEQMSAKYTVIELDSYMPEANLRSLLTAIHEAISMKAPKRRSLIDWARQLVECVNDKERGRDVVLVIHALDSPNLREPSSLSVLQALAASPRFKIVASVGHVNRMLIFNARSLAAFRWAHIDASTWLPSEAETFAGSSALLGLSSSAAGSSHTMGSLDVLWQSLNEHARSIFHAFFSLVYGPQDAPRDVKSFGLWQLFEICKDNFWVSSDAALRQQLVEFSDHRIIRIRRGADGNERIVPMLERSLAEAFLAQQERPLEDIQGGNVED